MIYINDDKAVSKKPDYFRIIHYKGKMSDTLLVIEDVIDLSKPNPENHKCICKCLQCGQIYPRLVPVREIREKRVHCRCSDCYTSKKLKFIDKKGEMLKFLISERNRLQREAVFKEDEERIIKFDMIIHFLNSPSLKNYFRKGIDLR